LAMPTVTTGKSKVAKPLLPSVKQYREADGQFYFKLLSPEGRLLVQSLGFASGKEAATAIAALQQQGAAAWPDLQRKVQPLSEVTFDDVKAALELLMHSAKTH
jgi:tryptophanyl-tRNA synthetase